MARGSKNDVDLRRLGQILGAYGADPARWPAEERAGALRLLADSAEAATMRDNAQALDSLLDEAPGLEPTPELMAEILARPDRSRRLALLEALWPFGPIWRPALGMAAAVVLGVTVGALTPPPFGDVEALQSSLSDEIDGLAFASLMDLENGQ
jgi:anti-sigma-K factor RskA